MTGFGITDRGLVRAENQDCFVIRISSDRKSIVAVVCDGMGGARSGDTASSLAANTFISEMGEIQSVPPGEIEDILKNVVSKTNTTVFEKAISSAQYSGMGTTLVGVVVIDSVAHFINVGDSRAYHITNGAITRITRDHSIVEDMLLMGELTQEQALHHPNRNLITKAIGTEPRISGDVFECELSPGDYILLCSDGLTNLLADQELFTELEESGDLEGICKALVKKSIEKGAPDNVTVVLIKNELG